MENRSLGPEGLVVSALGLGCMGMSEFYGPTEEAQGIATLERSLELGVTFWDTADVYGQGRNEQLLAKVLKAHRSKVVLATKFGLVRDEEGGFQGVTGRPDYIHRACDASLQRLGVEHIDLYYQHRVDPEVPIEETVGAMARLVEQGKVRHLGLSEASAGTLRRAVKEHPITALQTEYSLWSRDLEDEILPTARELGISLVAYSPLGRGFLTGAIRSVEDLTADDWRHQNPRFQEETLQENLRFVERLEAMADRKGTTAAQLALAWLLAQGEDVVPIPGTTKVHRLEQNAAAVHVPLSVEEAAEIEEALPPSMVAGERYPRHTRRFLDQSAE